MIVPKSRETSAVYMQQDGRRGQYICSKTGEDGSIYAARQGMRACNTNMRNPIVK